MSIPVGAFDLIGAYFLEATAESYRLRVIAKWPADAPDAVKVAAAPTTTEESDHRPEPEGPDLPEFGDVSQQVLIYLVGSSVTAYYISAG